MRPDCSSRRFSPLSQLITMAMPHEKDQYHQSNNTRQTNDVDTFITSSVIYSTCCTSNKNYEGPL